MARQIADRVQKALQNDHEDRPVSLGRRAVETAHLILALVDEAYEKPAWHGPNLSQSIRGLSAKQAAWRPGPGRHNIWEITLHGAYWKYVARRRIEGAKRGSFALKGSNFFARPEEGKLNEAAWKADKALLDREHRALREAVAKVLQTGAAPKLLRHIYGVALHDVYHAGQVRLLRRLQGRGA
jgi:DinB superfamily